MAVLPIHVVPEPVLRRKSKRVRAIDGSVQKLVADMLETLHAAPGRVGLAAPQVGIPLRVIVIGLPEEEDIALINPEIMRRKGERVVTEGCLSIPGYFGVLKRAESIRVKARDVNGREIKIKADELLAQALEHEVDHLNGVLFIDRLESPDKLYKVEPESVEL